LLAFPSNVITIAAFCFQMWAQICTTIVTVLRPCVDSWKLRHTCQFYGHFPRENKFTPMVLQDNLGWPFSPELKWINTNVVKYQTVAWIPPRLPPAGQRQITSTNTCFIRHCPNQSEHHATLFDSVKVLNMVKCVFLELAPGQGSQSSPVVGLRDRCRGRRYVA
jgi:hypothetical protein